MTSAGCLWRGAMWVGAFCFLLLGIFWLPGNYLTALAVLPFVVLIGFIGTWVAPRLVNRKIAIAFVARLGLPLMVLWVIAQFMSGWSIYHPGCDTANMGSACYSAPTVPISSRDIPLPASPAVPLAQPAPSWQTDAVAAADLKLCLSQGQSQADCERRWRQAQCMKQGWAWETCKKQP